MSNINEENTVNTENQETNVEEVKVGLLQKFADSKIGRFTAKHKNAAIAIGSGMGMGLVYLIFGDKVVGLVKRPEEVPFEEPVVETVTK